eukprot:5082600-Pyramimonas_sp.AAC.1
MGCEGGLERVWRGSTKGLQRTQEARVYSHDGPIIHSSAPEEALAGGVLGHLHPRLRLEPSGRGGRLRSAKGDVADVDWPAIRRRPRLRVAHPHHALPAEVATANSPVQSSPVQSGPVQSSPVQSSAVKSGPVRSSPVQSGPVLILTASRFY